MTLSLSHFSAALVFATFSSVVLGITQKSTPRDMVRYGIKCFAWFTLGLIGGGWLMWIVRR